MKMANPAHPGEIIREEILPPYDLTVKAAADLLGVSRPTFSAFLNCRSRLSGDLAIRIEKVFGVRMEVLMEIQTDWDIARASKRADEIRLQPFAPAFADPLA